LGLLSDLVGHEQGSSSRRVTRFDNHTPGIIGGESEELDLLQREIEAVRRIVRGVFDRRFIPPRADD
jgi:hypothetical protein